MLGRSQGAVKGATGATKNAVKVTSVFPGDQGVDDKVSVKGRVRSGNKGIVTVPLFTKIRREPAHTI